MYLRPASWACITASPRLSQSRTLASLISMGRLIPATTSTWRPVMQDKARFDGVPPNMSVKTTTPDPVSTRRHGVENIRPADLHVVLGADRDRLDLLLRAHDMLERGAKFRRQSPMCDEHHSNHIVSFPAPGCAKPLFCAARSAAQAECDKFFIIPSFS